MVRPDLRRPRDRPPAGSRLRISRAAALPAARSRSRIASARRPAERVDLPRTLLALIAAGLTLLTACPAPPVAVGDPDAGLFQDAGEPVAQSAKANVRFKRSTRLANDFAQALGLAPAALCKELGLYSCTELVHPLALGGVDPYAIGLYEPLPFTGATSPIVVDRVALNGCIQRVDLDLAAPAQALLFKGLTPDGAGRLPSLDAPAVRDALDTLYKRALLRPIAESEVAHLKQLYRDIEANGTATPAKAWMQLSCFAVLTSAESLFY